MLNLSFNGRTSIISGGSQCISKGMSYQLLTEQNFTDMKTLPITTQPAETEPGETDLLTRSILGTEIPQMSAFSTPSVPSDESRRICIERGSSERTVSAQPPVGAGRDDDETRRDCDGRLPALCRKSDSLSACERL